VPFFKVIQVGGRAEIVEVVEPRPPDHPVLGPLAQRGDVVALFLLSYCSFEPGAAVTAKELHWAYMAWAGREEGEALTPTALGRKLTEFGFQRDKLGPGFTTRRLGLKLLRDAPMGTKESEG